LSERFVEKRLRSNNIEPYWSIYSIQKKTDDLIRLDTGDPDFSTPDHIVNALIEAVKEGYTHYPPRTGIHELKESLANYHSKYGIKRDPSEVIVTCGGKPALYMSMAGILNPGDEVILTDPYFVDYLDRIQYLKTKKVTTKLDPKLGFHLDPEDLKRKITNKSKMIILCNPNNPTGTVFSQKELSEIADIAIDNDLVILSDEIYNEFVYDNRKHYSISSLPGMKERTIVLLSFSKTFAMTGWRLGCILADEAITSRISRIPFSYRPATFIQKAGVAALHGTWEPTEKMIEIYNERRKFFHKRVNEIEGLDCFLPEGAFYAFPKIIDKKINSIKFCERLLKEKGVMTFPGVGFGLNGEYHFRVALVTSIEVLRQAINRIEEFMKDLK
jgi:aspartate/methionine/tyrosine aminotransferase